MCIDIMEIWFGIANRQLLSIMSYLPVTQLYFHFRMITSKYQSVFTKLGVCIDFMEIGLGCKWANFINYLPAMQ